MSAAPAGGPTGQPPQDGSGSSTDTRGLQWEGDRMFNIYIYDYCTKRGFLKTARELVVEAELSPDSQPPINAKQGLLFEWWSVFWVLFTAKSQGQGSDDALLYTQHQAHQAAQKQMQNSLRQAQPPRNPMVNGAARMPMPNGVGPSGQVPIPAGSMPQASAFPPSNAGAVPQINGINNGPSAPGVPPAQPPQTFQPMIPSQRSGPQGRVPNGAPFQSPTMAHSPQHTGGAPGQPQSHPPPGMNQMGAPHMASMQRGNMLPPGVGHPQGVPQNAPGQQQYAPQQAIRSSSRPATPASQNGAMGMMHRSPSMAARQTPTGMIDVNAELRSIPPPLMGELKQQLGLADKDIQTWTLEEKNQVISTARSRPRPGNQRQNAVAGPSGTPTMQSRPGPQPQPGQGQRMVKRNSSSPGGPEESGMPSNDSSPPANKRPRRSPAPGSEGTQVPFTTIMQPGPGAPIQVHPNSMMRPQGPMGGPPMGGNFQPGMQAPGMPMSMNQIGASPMMSHPVAPGQPGGMGGMNPGMPQMQFTNEQQYRQSMHNMHKNNLQGNALRMLPQQGNTNPPSGPDPNFQQHDGSQGQRLGGPQFPGGPGPNNRMVQQNKPGGSMMPPPPSPAMNGVKPPGGGPKTDGVGNEQGSPNGRTHGSPHNPAVGIGQQGQPGGPSVGPSVPNAPQQQQSNPGPHANLGAMTAPSPFGGGMGQPGRPGSEMAIGADLFGAEFMNIMDPGTLMFDDLNFERDFGGWFAQPDDNPSLA